MPSWHAKFSASSMSRIEKCPGSVTLSEGLPDRDSIYSIEGTKAHTVLETILTNKLARIPWAKDIVKKVPDVTNEMIILAGNASEFILKIYNSLEECDGQEIAVETKVTLPWI